MHDIGHDPRTKVNGTYYKKFTNTHLSSFCGLALGDRGVERGGRERAKGKKTSMGNWLFTSSIPTNQCYDVQWYYECKLQEQPLPQEYVSERQNDQTDVFQVQKTV